MPVTIDGTNGVSLVATDGVPTAAIQAGAVTTPKLADADVTAAKMDGAQTGTAPVYGARAWVNFNGTGTIAIRASGNVTSITDNGTGDYTLNYTTALPDTSYAIAGMVVGFSATDNSGMMIAITPGATAYTTTNTYSTTATRITCGRNAAVSDFGVVALMVIR